LKVAERATVAMQRIGVSNGASYQPKEPNLNRAEQLVKLCK